MDVLRRLSLAFASGCFGVLLFYVAIRAGLAAGLINPPEAALKFLTSKAFLYRQVVWGGIWGFAFMIPFLKGKWWLRGPIVGFVASLAAIFVFGSGAIPPAPRLIAILVLNMGFWGLTAAFWHDKAVKAG
jgi:hypothetical protein